jgi:hypothetical protein
MAAAMIFALVFCWFAVRWQFGNMFAELTQPSEPNAAQIASLARSLAPSDPLPTWLAASKLRDDFSEEASQRSLELMQRTARLGPMDYRWWIELGRAYEQTDQITDAEAAFQRAIELAPEYTFPRWQFGNFLLRQDRSGDAFAQLKKATEKSSVYREQVFSLAWDYFDKDPKRVEELAADTPDVRANLALFYAVRSGSEDSLRMWNSLTDEKKAEHIETAKVIAQGLYHKGLFRQALEFAKQTGIDSGAEQETVTNGGFETGWGIPDNTLFGWKVVRTEGRVDILADVSVKKEGERSAKINFRSFDRAEFYNISQVVTVQPGARYRLSFFLRTEDLTSAGMPLVQVWNIEENGLIATTEPFPAGSADWKQYAIEFTAPENVQGIAIRTARNYCGDGCPIVGIMWYDDFRIQKL